MDRRGFLRGTLLTGGAALVAPALVTDGLASADSSVAILQPSDHVPPQFEVDRIIQDLTARLNAHVALFGEAPKAMFVNRFELRAYVTALSPSLRYQNERLAKQGVPNVMFKGVPVISVDNDTVRLEYDND